MVPLSATSARGPILQRQFRLRPTQDREAMGKPISAAPINTYTPATGRLHKVRAEFRRLLHRCNGSSLKSPGAAVREPRHPRNSERPGWRQGHLCGLTGISAQLGARLRPRGNMGLLTWHRHVGLPPRDPAADVRPRWPQCVVACVMSPIVLIAARGRRLTGKSGKTQFTSPVELAVSILRGV